MSGSLLVNEVYLSLQGESTFAGLPCVFVRMTGCNLRCSYCDTAYAFTEGERRSLEEVRSEVHRLAAPYEDLRVMGHRMPLIEFTGGEPLLQPGARDWIGSFCDDGWTVLIETSGAHDLGKLHPKARCIMDLKTPSSGESGRNRWENIALLKPEDEVKIVIGTWEDYAWAKEMLERHQLTRRCPILFSWVAPLAADQRHPSLKQVPEGHTPLTRLELVEAIISDHLPVRFQLQMHKFIWQPDQRGV